MSNDGAFHAYQSRGLQHGNAKSIGIEPAETDFQRELRELLNRHSMENESGTADFILSEYLEGCLKLFNQTVGRRANWRDESVELPALQRMVDELEAEKNTVPLVMYDGGRKNDIGTVILHVTPGEMQVDRPIVGAIPVFDDDIVVVKRQVTIGGTD